MTPEFYLSLVTMHGTIMVFFVLTTAPQGGFGNYFLPIQIGARDMAFPVLNMLSFWVTFVGLAGHGGGLLRHRRRADLAAGPPIRRSARSGEIAGPGQGLGQTLWIISIAIFCVGVAAGGAELHHHHARTCARKGMSLMRMPLTVWAWFTTAILALLAFPVLLAGGILLLLDRDRREPASSFPAAWWSATR